MAICVLVDGDDAELTLLADTEDEEGGAVIVPDPESALDWALAEAEEADVIPSETTLDGCD